MKIRPATADDKKDFVELTIRLSEFNRKNHLKTSKLDDFKEVQIAIREKSIQTFENRDENVQILVAQYEKKLIGYALGKIYVEEESADNGTGLIGLFDELYIDSEARGYGLGQKLLDEMMIWFKSKGINRVKLHAYSWNLNAKELYEKNGFNEYAVAYEKIFYSTVICDEIAEAFVFHTLQATKASNHASKPMLTRVCGACTNAKRIHSTQIFTIPYPYFWYMLANWIYIIILICIVIKILN